MSESVFLPTDSGHASVLILGAGRSGLAAARLARLQGRGVTVLDEGQGDAHAEAWAKLTADGVRLCPGWKCAQWHETPSLAVISPGIGPESVLGRLAQGLDCPVIGELEFGFLSCDHPVIAVTGTNGKTTTVELLTHCLQRAGCRAVAAGNIGLPLSAAVLDHPDVDVYVTEVSSYQLDTCHRFSPDAAAILNMSPDHLDRYATVEDYYASKSRLLRLVKDPGRSVIRRDLLDRPSVQAALGSPRANVTLFSSDPEDETSAYTVADGGTQLVRRCAHEVTPIISVSDLKIQGRHNVENALAAIALAGMMGIQEDELIAGLKTFRPSPHRMELVMTNAGVRYINDSKSTNPDSLCRAIEAVSIPGRRRILLIAGGLDKGLNFHCARPLLKSAVKAVFLLGKCRERLAKQWGDVVSCNVFGTMSEVVNSAIEASVPGDIVLLSPGCASMDMFANYEERGAVFRDLVKVRVAQQAGLVCSAANEIPELSKK